MEVELKNTKSYIKSFMANTKQYYKNFIINTPVKRRYGDFKLNATGQLADSLEISVEGSGNDITFELLANDYIHKLDEGSRSVSANLNELVDWIESKPVTITPSATLSSMGGATPQNLAKLIQKSLGRNGIQPMNFLHDLYENRYRKLFNEIFEPVIEDYSELIDEMLSEAGYEKKGREYTIEIK